jgi:Mn-containing catalase
VQWNGHPSVVEFVELILQHANAYADALKTRKKRKDRKRIPLPEVPQEFLAFVEQEVQKATTLFLGKYGKRKGEALNQKSSKKKGGKRS